MGDGHAVTYSQSFQVGLTIVLLMAFAFAGLVGLVITRGRRFREQREAMDGYRKERAHRLDEKRPGAKSTDYVEAEPTERVIG